MPASSTSFPPWFEKWGDILRPCGIPEPVAGDNPSPVLVCKEHFDTVHNKVAIDATTGMTKLQKEPPDTQLYHATKAMLNDPVLKFEKLLAPQGSSTHGAEAVKAFTQVAKISTALTVQSCWAWSGDLTHIAVPGCGGILTCHAEYVLVLLLKYEDLCAANYTFLTLEKALQDDNSKLDISKAPVWGLPPGHSVSWPFGYVPLISACPLSESEDSKDQVYAAYTINWSIGKVDVRPHDQVVLLDMETCLIKSMALNSSKIFDKVQKDVKEWSLTWKIAKVEQTLGLCERKV